jgi:hypothetical protein
MRCRLLLTTALIAAATVVGPVARVAAAGPPPCIWANSSLAQCTVYAGAGHRGSIGLLGDSVLDGSADAMSNPGLPKLLSGAGWGPIAYVATLGMRTYWDLSRYPGVKYSNTSGVWWVQRWHAAGFYPSVVVVNLGNNHLGECTRATYQVCKQRIDQMLDAIGPTATVWWPKTNFNKAYAKYTINYEASLGWNLALDKAAAQRKNLVVWDWPTALATSNPKITVDKYGIHPVSALEYVKRSKLMLAQINTYMPAHFAGPAVTQPTVAPAGLRFVPFKAVSANDGTVVAAKSVAAGATFDVALSGNASVAPGARAVAFTVNVTNPSGAGTLTVYRCGDARPATTNISFAAHEAQAAQAITRVSWTGHVCFHTTAAITLTATTQGSFVPAPKGDALVLTGNVRTTITPATASPVSITAPSGDAVTVDVMVSSAGGNGRVRVYDCDQPMPSATTVFYAGVGTFSGTSFVHTSASHHICASVTPTRGGRPKVVIDQHHVFRPTTGLSFTPVVPIRLLDTATARGGWYGRQVAAQVLSLPAAPAAARLVSASITMTKPLSAGVERAYACGATSPPGIAVAARSGATVTGSVLATVKTKLCVSSTAITDTRVDLTGWWS